MSASSFIVNLQWYLLSLPPPSPTLPSRPSHPFPISTPDITPTYEYPPIPLNPPRTPPSPHESRHDRKSHPLPSARPPIIALVIDWIIKVLITHRALPPPRSCARALNTPSASYPLVTIPLCSVPWQIICSDEA